MLRFVGSGFEPDRPNPAKLIRVLKMRLLPTEKLESN